MAHVAINELATGKLPPGDPLWARFNDSFDNRDLDPIELANEIYLGHSYAPWFDGRRKIENFVEGQHLAVDMDTGDERSTLSALRRHPLVGSYGTLIHTTPSHTNNEPRARAVFILDRPIADPAKYSAAAKFLISQFDGADSQTFDAGRFFFGSKDCDIEFLDRRLPVDHLRALYARWVKRHSDARRGAMRGNGGVPPFAPEKRPQGAGNGRQVGDRVLTLGDVRGKLETIDPWSLSYDDWVRVLMALHGDFGDDALPLAVEWGDGEPGEIERKWRSFKRGGNMSGAVTAGTIIEFAKRYGGGQNQ